MKREEALEALQLLRSVVRQARDDSALGNWGLIWMIHAFTNGAGFVLTDVLLGSGRLDELGLWSMWAAIVGLNVVIVFLLKKRAGARSFVENQLWSIWLSFVAAMALLGVVNHTLGVDMRLLSPAIGLFAAYAFTMMATLIDRRFFFAALLFVAVAIAMARWPDVQFTLFGVVWGVAQLAWGAALHVQKRRQQGAARGPELA